MISWLLWAKLSSHAAIAFCFCFSFHFLTPPTLLPMTRVGMHAHTELGDYNSGLKFNWLKSVYNL